MELPLDVRAKLVERDPAALGLLFDLFFDSIRSYLRRSVGDDTVAEDLAQDVFLRVHQGLQRYDPRRAIRPWIFTVAANRLTDYWRSTGRRSELCSLDEEGATPLPAPAEPPTSELEEREARAALVAAVARLPETLRVVVELRTFEELPFEAIACALQIHPLAARKRFSRAVVVLRNELCGAVWVGMPA